MREHLGRSLRGLSYFCVLLAPLWSLWRNSSGAGRGCANVACVGSGIGDGLVWLMAVGLLLAAAATINALALMLMPTPASRGRKIELALFCLPILLCLAVLAAFIAR
ncbi:hypothetical protein [Chitinimonas taiwanensis]|uniref:hypothetical protein n=1 Tax=Chitinimonas taiwanensis TaxID=240412 RepID=UPI0035AE5BFD